MGGYTYSFPTGLITCLEQNDRDFQRLPLHVSDKQHPSEVKVLLFLKKNKKTHQPGMEEITGCFRQLQILLLLLLSLLSEFCHVDLLVMVGLYHYSEGEIIFGK